MKHKMAGILSVLLFTLFLAGCGGSTENDVSFTMDAEIQGQELTISGAATVPDGAIICYEVTASDRVVLGNFARGGIKVDDGSYLAAIDISEFEPSELQVWAAFQTVMASSSGKQPPEIIEQYGEAGEKMTGEQVVKSGALYRVEKTKYLKYNP